MDGHFGVILGSGKTVAVTDLCERYPNGVMYLEIVEPNMFHKDLATWLGMRLHLSTVEDLILGYIYAEYRHHY